MPVISAVGLINTGSKEGGSKEGGEARKEEKIAPDQCRSISSGGCGGLGVGEDCHFQLVCTWDPITILRPECLCPLSVSLTEAVCLARGLRNC